MSYLSGDLKREVNIDMFKKVLHQCKVLKNNFSGQFLDALC